MSKMKKKENQSEKRKKISSSSSSVSFYIFFLITGIILGMGYFKFFFSFKVQKNSQIIPEWEGAGSGSPIDLEKPWRTSMPGKYKRKVWKDYKEDHPNPDIRKFQGDGSEKPPGHMGIGVQLEEMDEKSSSVRSQMFKRHYFEEYISELIPLDRKLPDWRNEWCSKNYDKSYETLEPTSVIICYHNEARSTLLRSVHSIVNRTPKVLLKEILLMDDSSTHEHLGSGLDEHIKNNFPDGLVKVIRLPERHGLMRCRMAGVESASASVLTFLDSHIEASVGWIQPLLHRIKENPKSAVSPVIDAINATNMHYTFISKDIYGLMNWDMVFEWRDLADSQKKLKKHPWDYHSSPIMAGGLFSIRKDWFKYLGYYDEGMSVWGGENFELSFKAWMCGGTVEISPCSRVGHVFRNKSPYKVLPSDISRNVLRVAEVWMDEYKFLVYDRLSNRGKTGIERLINFGNVSSRKELRKSLDCEDFSWYLKNIAQELPVHQLIGAGLIFNPNYSGCLDANDRAENVGKRVAVTRCADFGTNQYWLHDSNRNWILRDYNCIGVSSENFPIVEDCRKSGKWTIDIKARRIKHSFSNGCLTIADDGNSVSIQSCTLDDKRQDWTISKHNSGNIPYSELL